MKSHFIHFILISLSFQNRKISFLISPLVYMKCEMGNDHEMKHEMRPLFWKLCEMGIIHSPTMCCTLKNPLISHFTGIGDEMRIRISL
jgi:hypothetical protein